MGDFMMELWGFMSERKKFWLLPIVVSLVLLGGLIVLTQGSVVAPFIYSGARSRPSQQWAGLAGGAACTNGQCPLVPKH